MKRAVLLFAVLVCLSYGATAQQGQITQGTLSAFGDKGALGACPLKHTDVKAEISGFIARVNVRQEFENSFAMPIEAVYTFPLSETGAVDRMTMTIGSRVISGSIRKREEARKIYESAKNAGQAAALLDQERPNIFTQSVANIMPGEKIVVEISYVETLKYEEGLYEFVFPMVVGPRYIPGTPTGKAGGGFSPDTDRVPDGSKVTPRVARTRAGHDISIEVNIDAGVPLVDIESKLHRVSTERLAPANARVALADERTIPNKDFILKYAVNGGRIEDALLTHRDERGGFFSLILQPPDLGRYEDVAPKEIVFVLDTSGSMGGFPIEKAKEAMKMSLLGLFPDDTFNLITFAGDTHILFDEPVPATEANLEAALSFLESRSGGGGTEMMKAIRAALDPSDSLDHTRIVCFMTDGYVGNEGEIIKEVQKHPKARVFSFGIGDSVNRWLLEKIAEEGNGEASIVTLEDEGAEAARKFYERVRAPILTDISIDWNGLPVSDVYPSKIPDLFSAKPVILNGRYIQQASGSIILRGKIGGQVFERELKVELPETESRHDVLGTIWARKRIDELTKEDYDGVQNRTADEALAGKITNVALEFGIMSQYTSFVAVEDRISNPDGNPDKVDVPVELADGTFGTDKDLDLPEIASTEGDTKRARIKPPGLPAAISSDPAGFKAEYGGATNGNITVVTRSGSGSGGGSGTGTGSGSGNGVGSVSAMVTVTGGNSSTVSTSDASIGNTVTAQTIQALPLNTRFSSLLQLSPGVSRQAIGGGFVIDGASGAENVFIVDGSEITNFRTGNLSISNSIPTGRIAVAGERIERPLIPKGSKFPEEGKSVTVAILVDETGDVYAAKAADGEEKLRKPSEKAALGSSFTPAVFLGTKLGMSGVLKYRFLPEEKVEVTVVELKVIYPPDLKKQMALRQKVHFWVYGVIDRLRKRGTDPAPNEERFVTDGIATIRVTITDASAKSLQTLKDAGMKVESVEGDIVRGKIAVGSVSDLAELDFVKYISP